MENFKQAFLQACTSYAEYIETKINSASRIQSMHGGGISAETGEFVRLEDPLEAQKQICEDMRALNEIAGTIQKIDLEDKDNKEQKSQ